MTSYITDTAMLSWLKTQVFVLEAWREDVASRAHHDLGFISALENHYAWLCAEIIRLEDYRNTPTMGKFGQIDQMVGH